MSIPAGLFLMTLALLLAAACAGMETALISTSKLTLATGGEDEERRAELFRLWDRHSDEMLILLIMANVLSQMVFIALGILVLAPLAPGRSILFTVFAAALPASVLLIVLGRIIPQSFARKYSVPIALFLIPPLQKTAQTLGLVTRPFLKMLTWIHRETGPGHLILDEPFITSDRIHDLMELGEQEGSVRGDQSDMITSIFDFSSRIVREIMRPRTDMICVADDTPLDQIPAFVREHPKSRIPVFTQQKDRIVGILYIKDLFLNFSRMGQLRVRDIMHTPLTVPETARIEDLLRIFKSQKRQMAIVVDSFGGTAGLVTLEDVLEEIVGDIQDEHDPDEAELIRREGPDSLVVLGKTPLHDLEKHEIFLQKHSDYDTINGFLQGLLGTIPGTGEEIIVDALMFKVLEADEKKVNKVRITHLEDSSRGTPSAG